MSIVFIIALHLLAFANSFQHISVTPLKTYNTIPPNQGVSRDFGVLLDLSEDHESPNEPSNVIRCAILGCGMMGQEHISYITGYPQCRIDYLCDPHEPSLQASLQVLDKFQKLNKKNQDVKHRPEHFADEADLLKQADNIDLLVLASPNHLHADTLQRWRHFGHLTVLCEKPIAVSQQQHDELLTYLPQLQARVWVAMEYRFIPAIAKLLSLLPTIGDLKMVTIRENRYPFLHKIGGWNRNRSMTGDTLVEKCCHFFDLFRLITGQEAVLPQVRALAQRGLNYQDEYYHDHPVPIIDSAYVFLPFCNEAEHQEHKQAARERHDSTGDEEANTDSDSSPTPSAPGVVRTIGCLELCMYAEGSRHQEEIIVTGTKGRLEAYLPENKVYAYERPSHEQWSDRSVPPPKQSVRETVYDCSNVRDVHGIDFDIPTHGGYHYSSTAVEWYQLLAAMDQYKVTGVWKPGVSFTDGLRAVEIGLQATKAIVNEQDDGRPQKGGGSGADYQQSHSLPV